MSYQHQLGRVRNALQVGRGSFRPGPLVALAGQQAPVPQDQDPQGVDEWQRAGLLRNGIGIQAVRLEVLIVELERQPGAHRRQQVAGRPIDEVALAAMDQGDHEANARSIFAAM